jgi:putative ABC transport system permease protein
LVLMPLVVGLLAGSYPAFYLSRFQPITVLKGQLTVRSRRSFIRNALVVFQFTTCIILIVGTLVVYSQLNFIQNKNLGFNKEQVLIVNGTGVLGGKAKAFKNEVSAMPGVVNGTVSGYLPVPSSRSDYSFSTEAVMDSRNGFNMQVWQVDEDYVPVFGMQLLKGRNFSKDFPGDSNSLIINETIAKTLGFEDPIGKIIYSKDFSNSNVTAPFRIIGLVKNFHYQSLKENIGPLALCREYNPYSASFRIKTDDVQGLLKKIESKWTAMVPAHAFRYRFLDDSFNAMYRSEQRVGKIAVTFAVLAILIACLGLFGLVTFMAEQRTKEIGIRKVLGASVGTVMQLLSRDFLRLVVIAFVIAAPVAWWAMHKWLEDFAYRVDLQWWVFAAAGSIALLIALITVSVQAIKAAMANPVKSLRTE